MMTDMRSVFLFVCFALTLILQWHICIFLKVGPPLGCILSRFVSSYIFPLISNVLVLQQTRATTFQSSGGTPPLCSLHPVRALGALQ